jgi:hypothetical protein
LLQVLVLADHGIFKIWTIFWVNVAELVTVKGRHDYIDVLLNLVYQ